MDVDYLGSRESAQEHLEFLRTSLMGRKLRLEVLFPEPFEPTPNSAKIVVYEGGNVAAEIDYLSTVMGYVGAHEDKLRRRAVEMYGFATEGKPVRVMHPFDCLRSRLYNLLLLPNKRNTFQIAQASLSVDILRAYLEGAIDHGAAPRDVLLPIAEEIIQLASSDAGLNAFRTYGIDVISAIPVKRYPMNFQRHRYQQAIDYISRRRAGRRGGKLRLLRGRSAQ